ncbi:hypothetical protein [Acidimangrovimonas sediminis]|uniref:hypothetical protein n=1 Tax=Acidimangrovimonas sediminis TaxID=2056283 RepID=UPI000C7F7FF0|nr:hypothetical protein [Acidimangrovimonas sediminis]
MKAEREPQVYFIGDSHCAALLAGARQLGLRAEGASWSGSTWHEGRFALNDNGITPRGLPQAGRMMDELRARVGRDKVVPEGMPVVSTLGFHLGRLVPPIGWNGHEMLPRDEGFPEGADIVSRAFLRDYLEHHRRRHFRIARRWARQERLILVVPPPAFERPNYRAVREILVDWYRDAGLTVFDPAGAFAAEPQGLVPATMLEEDGVHGTPDYGARVLRAMVREGVLDLALPQEA